MMTAAVGLEGEFTMGLAYCRLPVLMMAAGCVMMGARWRRAIRCRVQAPIAGVDSAELLTNECKVLVRVGFRCKGLISCMPLDPRDSTTTMNNRRLTAGKAMRSNEQMLLGPFLSDFSHLCHTVLQVLCPNHHVCTCYAVLES